MTHRLWIFIDRYSVQLLEPNKVFDNWVFRYFIRCKNWSKLSCVFYQLEKSLATEMIVWIQKLIIVHCYRLDYDSIFTVKWSYQFWNRQFRPRSYNFMCVVNCLMNSTLLLILNFSTSVSTFQLQRNFPTSLGTCQLNRKFSNLKLSNFSSFSNSFQQRIP